MPECVHGFAQVGHKVWGCHRLGGEFSHPRMADFVHTQANGFLDERGLGRGETERDRLLGGIDVIGKFHSDCGYQEIPPLRGTLQPVRRDGQDFLGIKALTQGGGVGVREVDAALVVGAQDFDEGERGRLA
jgi:hypothetical protein